MAGVGHEGNVMAVKLYVALNSSILSWEGINCLLQLFSLRILLIVLTYVLYKTIILGEEKD